MANIILLIFAFLTVPVLFSSAIASTAWASVLSAACVMVFYGKCNALMEFMLSTQPEFVCA